MKRPVRLFSIFVFSIVMAAALLPATVSAVKFRRPVDFVFSPAISAYYDDDARANYAKKYNCSTSTVYDAHKGTDFRGEMYTIIKAGASGALYYRYDGCPNYGYRGSTCGGGFGNHVRIDHEGLPDGIGWVTIYAHMAIGSPAYQQSLMCGTSLGSLGSSGNSSGPHVHFEVRKYSYPHNDPFAGSCSGSTSFWQQVGSDGVPTTQCGS